MEGLHCFNPPNCSLAGLTLPVVEYDRTQGATVIGGLVYRGNLYPQMQGIYFYGDTSNGRIWGLKRNGVVWQNIMLLDSLLTITSFGEDESGELYLTNYATGDIYRISGPVKGDFDGDGKTDIAVWAASARLRKRVGCSGEQEKLLRPFVDRDRLTSRTGLVRARYNRLSPILWLTAIL